MMRSTHLSKMLVGMLIVGVARLVPGGEPGAALFTDEAPKFEHLWERQVDPRWQPGDEQENGITAEFVEFSPDGTLLLTGNGQGEAFVLRVEGGAILRTFRVYTEEEIDAIEEFNISGGRAKAMEVECGYFSPDGTKAAVAGNVKEVKVLGVDSGESITTLDANRGEVDGMAWSPSGKFFAHAARFSAVVRSADTWKEIHRVPHGSTGAVNSLDFTRDGQFMISAGGYGHAILTRTSDWTEVGDGLIERTSSIKSVRFSPNGEYVAAGYGGTNGIVVFRRNDMSPVTKQLDFYIEAVAWTSDGRYLLAGGRDGTGALHIFRTEDWKKVAVIVTLRDGANVEYIDVHQDRIAVCGEDARVHLFRIHPE